ncbi:hypothetical protein EV121DRAFT_216903 [Schizophyllum commune]
MPADDLDAQGFSDSDSAASLYSRNSPPESSGSDSDLPRRVAPYSHESGSSDDESTNQPDNPLVARVKRALVAIQREGLSLVELVDFVTWGDQACTRDPTIRGTRTAFMHSSLLPGILARWANPPRVSRRSRPEGASATMKTAALGIVRNVLTEELAVVSKNILWSPPDRELSAKELTSISFGELIPRVQKDAPLTWDLLRGLAYSRRQELHNSTKNPDKIVLTILSMLCYTRNKNCGRFQKAMSIYVKFKGLSAKAFDALHACGLVMSHKWTGNAVDKISKRAMDEVTSLMKNNQNAWLISYDNVQLPFRVYSQRLDNSTQFGNGTAGTIYFKRNSSPLGPETNKALKLGRAAGLRNPLRPEEISELENAAAPRVRTQAIWEILRFLIEAPEFSWSTYRDRKDPAVQRPPPTRALPHGLENATVQRMLGTVNIAEASYEDNERLIAEWLRQLGLAGEENKKKIGLEQVLFWIGDQLTVERLRGLYRFRAEEFNSYDRLDWLVPIFGWLHLMMAFANSLHKQYLGTTRGYGLARVFVVLNRPGLGRVQTKGIFYHNLSEAIHHVTEAHLRIDWKEVTGVADLAELRTRSASQLLQYATEIHDRCASGMALVDLDELPEHLQDDQLRQVYMWNRDALRFVVLGEALKRGDVGTMEDMLPFLAYRFDGGNNNKYCGEVLELMQGLYKEWPPAVAEFVRQHCWLVNMSGRADGFCPVDQAQEHNIKDIKVTYRSEGPSIDWDFLKKLHPAVPVIRELSKHMEEEFETLTRGLRHTIPKRDADVKALQEMYETAHLHESHPGRTARDKTDDFINDGLRTIPTTLDGWSRNRNYKRRTEDDWEVNSDG